MRYDIIFSDIDGTLVDDNHRIMPKTARKIRELAASGIPFVPVSARPPLGVKHVLSMLEISAPMICFCGGMITDDKGSVLFDAGMPVTTAQKIKEYFRERFPETCVCSYVYNRWLCDDASHRWVKYEIGATGMTPEEVLPGSLEESGKVHKLLCMGVPCDMDTAQKELFSLVGDEVELTRSRREYIEIMPKGVSKSRAMRILCDAYLTDISRSLVFGDNFNDLDMLKCAGFSIAMGNAPDEVKAVCSAVTDDNNSEGIFNALEKYIG